MSILVMRKLIEPSGWTSFIVFWTHFHNEHDAFILTSSIALSSHGSDQWYILTCIIDPYSCIIWLKPFIIHSAYMKHKAIFIMSRNLYIAIYLIAYWYIEKCNMFKKYFEVSAFILWLHIFNPWTLYWDIHISKIWKTLACIYFGRLCSIWNKLIMKQYVKYICFWFFVWAKDVEKWRLRSAATSHVGARSEL